MLALLAEAQPHPRDLAALLLVENHQAFLARFAHPQSAIRRSPCHGGDEALVVLEVQTVPFMQVESDNTHLNIAQHLRMYLGLVQEQSVSGGVSWMASV